MAANKSPVIFRKYAGTEFEIDDEEHLIVDDVEHLEHPALLGLSKVPYFWEEAQDAQGAHV